MAFNERLEIVELNAANEAVSLLNLNDGVHYMMEQGTFQVIAPEATPVLAADQRRWGGSREVGEVHQNGGVEWVAGVTATTEQAALEKVETLLAQLAANPYHAYILWQVPGASQPTLYEMRGTGTWAAKYSVAQVEGAQLFLFTVHIPVGPLAQGLPKVQYEKSSLTLPETLVLGTIPGDAPCKTEVSIETGQGTEEAFITGASGPYGVATDATFVYWANRKGTIGRAKLNGTEVNQSFITGLPEEERWITVLGENIYWANGAGTTIGRCKLSEPTKPTLSFITGANQPSGIVASGEWLYWPEFGAHTIARAKLTGAEVNHSFIAAGLQPYGIATDGLNLYWGSWEQISIAKCAISSPGSPDLNLIPLQETSRGIAVGSNGLYWATATGIGHATVEGTQVAEGWIGVEGVFGVALGGEDLYWAVEPLNHIGRAKLEEAPIWAQIAWAAKPTTGLATAPFGVLDSSEAESVRGWTYQTVTGAKGGKALYAVKIKRGAAYWNIDPATLTPDTFTNEVSVEVWARILIRAGLVTANLTLSAQPQDGGGYASPRYTDEWGSAGRPLVLPEGNAHWRYTRLGTLHLLVNPLAPRIWRLYVEGESDTFEEWGIDYLVVVPSLQRACSPSGKPNNSSFPQFISNIGPTVKTVKSNLSATLNRPGKNGHPDHGLGGQLMYLPPGETDLFVRLASQVPDSPTISEGGDQLSYPAKVTVTVTPRFFLARTV